MAARTSVAFSIFIVLLVLLHFILHVALGIVTTAPDLLTVAVLLVARRLSGGLAAALGLALGIVSDALALATFGALGLVYTILGYLGARSRDLFEGDSLLFVGVYVFIGKWLRDALYLTLTHSAHGEPWGSLLIAAPIAAIYAAIAAMVALTLYRAATGER
jgi:rod shape-determining protein MreD